MLTRVNEILIGKDIARTASLVAGVPITTINQDIALNEVLVVSRNFSVLDTTDEYNDSNFIYIVEGTDEIRTYNAPITGAEITMKRLITSAPIDGRKVKSYTKVQHVGKTEKVVTFPAIDPSDVEEGREYVLRFVYKDMIEHPGQFTETYRYVAKSGDDSTAIFDGLRKRIISYKGKLAIKGGARISTNALGTATLVLTGKAIPECTSTINDIDELTQVDFEAFFNYVDNDYQWTEVLLTAPKTYTLAKRGYGSWEAIRDIEKHAQSYRGIENRIWFPISKPVMRVEKNAKYNMFVIEHDRVYKSSDNQYNKETELTTIVAIAGAGDWASTASHQGENIEAVLDHWMSSLPIPKEDTTNLV